MDLWQLQIFCEVIEKKSFSEAGKAVHITQPTISSHIKEIESSFGCRLIDRLPKEAVPTKAGEILYRYARRIIDLNREARTAVSQYLGNISGELKIGGSTIPGTYILPKMVGIFKNEYPKIHISIEIGDTEAMINGLLSGDIELAVIGAPTGNNKISQFKFMEDEMLLVIPADHKWADRESITLKMLLDEPFICRETGSGTLKSIDQILSKQNLNITDLNVVAQMGSTEAVKQGISSGVGVSILSVIAASNELRAGSLKAVNIRGLNLNRNFYLARHKLRSASPLSITFENFLRQRFKL